MTLFFIFQIQLSRHKVLSMNAGIRAIMLFLNLGAAKHPVEMKESSVLMN